MRCMQCGAKLKKRTNTCPVCHERISFQNASEQYVPYREKRAQGESAGQAANPELEQEMNRSVSKKYKRNKALLTAGFLLLLMGIGAVCVLGILPRGNDSIFLGFFADAAEPAGEQEALAGAAEQSGGQIQEEANSRSKIEGIRDDYYRESMALLDEYFDPANLDKAKTLGNEEFYVYMNKANAALLAFRERAMNTGEEVFAKTLRELCLYSLSNDAEEGLAQESGGNITGEASKRLAERRDKANRLKVEFQLAENLKTLEKISAELNDGT